MKVLIAILSVVVVAGCKNPERGYDDDWVARKAQCRNGAWEICADIGHEARGNAPAKPVASQGAAPQVSEPIID
jgi:hypothetical protein